VQGRPKRLGFVQSQAMPLELRGDPEPRQMAAKTESGLLPTLGLL